MKAVMAKSILFLSIDGLTDALGQSQILPYLIGLSRQGFEITILSEEKKNKLTLHQSHIHSIIATEKITWQYIHFEESRNPFRKMYSVFQFYKQAKKISVLKKIDGIHSRSFLPAMVAYRLKKKLRIPYIYDIRGFFIEEKIDTGTLNPNHLLHAALIKYLHKIERKIFSNADKIITLTANSIVSIQKKNNSSILSENIHIIPTCVSYKEFNPLLFKSIEIKKALQISEDKKVLIYVGSMGSTYLLNEMLDFYKCLQNKNYIFLILTNDKIDQYSNLIRKKNILSENIKIISVLRQEVPKYLSIADIGISFIRPQFAKIASCPTKMGEMAAMGIPVVFNKNIGDLEVLNAQLNFGIALETFEAKDMAVAINKIEQMDTSLIRENSMSYFDLEKAIEKYTAIYNSAF
jgi:UDP-N-acetylglucosamine:LPS N-acetylglucosamine transferase